ncbi:MAG: AMP-binding protein [Porticoccaceae bacterium]|nr:AMP-binding protein [Porticoccaceae bacterium]
MVNGNLYAHFQVIFHRFSDKTALTEVDGSTLSYGQLDSAAGQMAASLSQLGVQRGDRVSVQVAKSTQALVLYLGCLRGGFVFHPLNTGYKEYELTYFLGNAEPVLMVCDQADVAVLKPLCQQANVSTLLTLNADGSGSLTDHVFKISSELPVADLEPDSLAALLYSSGTTGTPKGIMLSHENLRSNAVSLVKGWGFTEKDVLLHALPIFHVHGLFVALGCVFLSGASMRWLAGFDLDEILATLPLSTSMMGVPTYYTRLLGSDRFGRQSTVNIRLFISGSAPLLIETFDDFEARTGHRILERYGMTETNMNTSNPLNGERRAGTVGLPLPGVEVRITNDKNQPLAYDEIGSLQVRGGNVFKGYWKMPEKTAEDFTADGYFNTGDKGQISADGYVAIVGRAKDMVISGGLNIYPKEVELVIDELAGVLESAVIGVAHADFGEALVALVVRNGDIEEAAVITALKAQISGFKVPKRVVFVAQLPRNTMGKVQKNLLREEFANLLDIGQTQLPPLA